MGLWQSSRIWVFYKEERLKPHGKYIKKARKKQGAAVFSEMGFGGKKKRREREGRPLGVVQSPASFSRRPSCRPSCRRCSGHRTRWPEVQKAGFAEQVGMGGGGRCLGGGSRRHDRGGGCGASGALGFQRLKP
ncbi:uncharacterized protein [Gossypium hirsutum]|uniref:Uncharacterized protein n=1 Tax=Gossypium hirsutum TaxID=3635 RepID=A0ABM2ZNI5_GOSHI|nr:uncharacterized protein LOC121214083 [Gossypium hirsutum]